MLVVIFLAIVRRLILSLPTGRLRDALAVERTLILGPLVVVGVRAPTSPTTAATTTTTTNTTATTATATIITTTSSSFVNLASITAFRRAISVSLGRKSRRRGSGARVDHVLGELVGEPGS